MAEDDDLLLENLSPANIHQIAWEIRERSHDPHDARRLLHKFCELFDKGEPIPPELLRHFRDSFRQFLDSEAAGKKTIQIDTALGLTKGKKRSGIDDRTAKAIAIDIWKARLKGTSWDYVIRDAVAKFGWSKTKIEEVWSSHAGDALQQYQIELHLEGKSLSAAETENAEKILAVWRQKVNAVLRKEGSPPLAPE